MATNARSNSHGDLLQPAEVKIEDALPASALAARRLRRLIEAGDLDRGDRLPSERKLAEEFGVDRATVRNAFQRLQNEGLISTGSRGERYLARPAARQNGVMDDSIVMIGSYVGQPVAGHHAPGWGDLMSLACHRHILDRGFHAILFKLGVDREERIAGLLQQPPKGAILAEAAGERQGVKELADRFRAAGVPCVAYGDDDDLATFDRVASDHEAGAAMLTRWLIEQGRRRILMIAPPKPQETYWVRQRRAGYERALAEAGLPRLEPLHIPEVSARQEETDRNFEINTRLAAGYLMEPVQASEPVDGILCPSDGNAFPVAAACRLLGRDPHRDVTVVGYDNYYADSPERRLEPCPPAATVDKRNDVLGTGLVDLLLERLNAPPDAEPVRRFVEPELIVTGETDGTFPSSRTTQTQIESNPTSFRR